MPVPLLDLKAQYAGIKPEIDAAVQSVFESQYFIGGPEVVACEEEIAAYCGVPHAVGVSSGTDALLIALMAEGIGPGDEVITSPYTFFATAGSIHRTGAKPVFADVLPDSYNMDPAQVAAKVTANTKAIMPVHLYGQCVDMDPILEIAKTNKLVVIEDAAQAIGAEDKGRRAGSMGHYGCFSFFPSKNLGAAGDGGVVVTRDAERAERLALLRNHGMAPKYYHKCVGGNFRLDAIQAAVVRVKLRKLDEWTRARQANANRYDTLFAESGLLEAGVVSLPVHLTLNDPAKRHIFNQYCIRVEKRDALRAFLLERQVGHEVYYPVPLHLQECFAELGHKVGDFPVSEAAALETLALPIYPELSEEQAQEVVDAIASFFE